MDLSSMVSEGAEAVTCKVCDIFAFLPESNNNYTCNKYKLVVLLEKMRHRELRHTGPQFYKWNWRVHGQNTWSTLKRATGGEGKCISAEEHPTQEESTQKNVTHRNWKIRRYSELLLLSNQFPNLPLDTDSSLMGQGLLSQSPQSFEAWRIFLRPPWIKGLELLLPNIGEGVLVIGGSQLRHYSVLTGFVISRDMLSTGCMHSRCGRKDRKTHQAFRLLSCLAHPCRKIWYCLAHPRT